jgi:alcohol dehydrogenase (cytochrome c)
MVSAVTTTAGGLVISGELTGNLLLMDAASGALLNSINTGAPVGGGIVTYEVDGRQYIATNSGNAMLTFQTGTESSRTGSIVIYALPED